MRTFSKLKALCAYPEVLEKSSARRDAAAALGTQFHTIAERWLHARAWGEEFTFDAEEPVRGWMLRLMKVWAPPEGVESEVPLGLVDDEEPSYSPVTEPEPHVYVPQESGVRLLTAGRADWIWRYAGEPDVRVCDVKTGQFYLGPPEQLRQLLAQGFAAAKRAGAPSFTPGIYYARTGYFDWGPTIQVTDRQKWQEVVTAAKLPAEPRPGGWCLGCWDKARCPANPVQEAA